MNKPDFWINSYLYISEEIGAEREGRAITDERELMAFVARPRSKGVGTQAGVQGVIEGGEIDLEEEFGFGGNPADHSGQFLRDIQLMMPFYLELQRSLGIPVP